MREALLKFHRDALAFAENGLLGWESACNFDRQLETKQIAIFKSLVDFHKFAIEWLEAQRPPKEM